MSGFDYTKVTVEDDYVSQYMDDFESFGWQQDENLSTESAGGKTTLHFKRSRSILNKTELIRLQRHYEACMREISALKASEETWATIASLTCGIVGCAFMAGAVFAVTAAVPIIWLTVLLGIPGFALWGAAYFINKIVRTRRTAQVEPLIDAKYDEACTVCEKARQLL